MSPGTLARAAVVALAAWGSLASAQDFGAPGPIMVNTGGFSLLEGGMPSTSTAWSFEALRTARHALSELTTRALATRGGYGPLRIAVGLSQTGDPEIGWTALGVALGTAGAEGGAAVRAVARRDRHPEPEPTPLGAGVGAEAGAGAWIRVTPMIDLWAQAPQLWHRGAAPPLARGMKLGVAARVDELRAWFEIETAPLGLSVEPVHHAGVAAGSGPVTVWLAARDGPLRASIGVHAGAGVWTVGADAESHPVLGETLRVAVGLSAAQRRIR